MNNRLFNNYSIAFIRSRNKLNIIRLIFFLCTTILTLGITFIQISICFAIIWWDQTNHCCVYVSNSVIYKLKKEIFFFLRETSTAKTKHERTFNWIFRFETRKSIGLFLIWVVKARIIQRKKSLHSNPKNKLCLTRSRKYANLNWNLGFRILLLSMK